MRTRHVVVLLIAAAFCGLPITVTGQDAPLPAITPKPSVMLIALAIEPELAKPTPTLADAARANDFPTFDALYRAAGRPANYRALHELWSYSMTDPLGAFYGADTYAQLARAYDGYAAYIEDHHIVDSRGNVFYPTSETRAFLLTQALRGGDAPAVHVPSYERSTPTTPATPTPQRRRMRKAEAAPAPAPIQVAKAPVVPVERRPLRAPAPVTPVPAPAPVAEAATAPQARVPAPVAAALIAPTQPTEASSSFGRGLLLLIIGIVGVGLLAMIMRAPREIPSITPRRDP